MRHNAPSLAPQAAKSAEWLAEPGGLWPASADESERATLSELFPMA
jgi:hypothetical protein